MEVKEYQEKAHEFAFYAKPKIVKENGMHEIFRTAKIEADCDWTYPVMGLSEEAGEVSGKFAKIIRDKHGRIGIDDVQAIKKELGDCMWMIAEICTCLGISLEDVMAQNIQKLTDRKHRNVLSGSGDNR